MLHVGICVGVGVGDSEGTKRAEGGLHREREVFLDFGIARWTSRGSGGMSAMGLEIMMAQAGGFAV